MEHTRLQNCDIQANHLKSRMRKQVKCFLRVQKTSIAMVIKPKVRSGVQALCWCKHSSMEQFPCLAHEACIVITFWNPRAPPTHILL